MKTSQSSFRQNWIGFVSGAAYCIGAFLMFFVALSYGASCPESGSKACNIGLESLMPILFVVSLGSISVWSITFYLGQQLLLAFGMTLSDYSSSFFVINVMSGIFITATLFVWVIIGGCIQEIHRRTRK